MSRPRKMICVVVFFGGVIKQKSGVCSEPCSSLIRHRCLYTVHLWKMLDFSALLSKPLYTFYTPENGLTYTHYVAFYVEFRNSYKN